jgi:peptidoglycan lytic transglycosylase G
VKYFLLTLLFVVFSCLLFVGLSLTALFFPPLAKARTVDFKVERGETFSSVVHKLKENGVIPEERFFSLWARVWRLDKKIHWGFYHFELPVAPATALNLMIPGKGPFHRVTIPEGLTVREVADLLERAQVARRENLLAAAAAPDLLARLGLFDKGFEGYLFPDTYYFPASATASEVLAMMVEQFHAVFDPMMRRPASEPRLTAHEVVTLASLIEKETGDKAERPLISAVFHNRLKINLPLQSDPTAMYGQETPSKAPTHKDLQNPSPYNTYRIKGLPPGPISNPGLSSLKAALAPADVPYLFFVSKNDGSHLFSVDLADHNRAVKLYQGGGSERPAKPERR